MGTHRRVGVGRLALAAWMLGACTLARPTNLPSSPDWHGGCNIGVGQDATLHGAASDARATWATDNFGGDRIELLWPIGYSARFSPHLEVLDDHGAVVAHEGDLIIGSCLRQPKDGGSIRVDAEEVRPPTWQPGDG